MQKKVIAITLLVLSIMSVPACGRKEELTINDEVSITDNEIIDTAEQDIETLEASNVKVNGPYGSIQISVPENWEFEICDVDDETLMGSFYGIHLKPTAESEGFIEIGYNDSFGVCGTGLETQGNTLTNGEVNIGYYDGNDNWSFIEWVTLDGKLKNIVVLCNADWGATYLDELLCILDSVTFDDMNQTGGIGVYEASSELGIDDGYLMVSAKNVSSIGATIVFNYSNYRKDNSDGQDELSFGTYLPLAKKVGTDWIPVEYQIEETPAFEDVAYKIRENEETTYDYNWEGLYGSLDPGEYQITIHLNNEAYIYAYFILR